jgi:hypothetical protein
MELKELSGVSIKTLFFVTLVKKEITYEKWLNKYLTEEDLGKIKDELPGRKIYVQ